MSMLQIRYVVLSCVTWSKVIVSSVRTRYNQATRVILPLTALYPTSCAVLYGAPPLTVYSSHTLALCISVLVQFLRSEFELSSPIN